MHAYTYVYVYAYAYVHVQDWARGLLTALAPESSSPPVSTRSHTAASGADRAHSGEYVSRKAGVVIRRHLRHIYTYLVWTFESMIQTTCGGRAVV